MRVLVLTSCTGQKAVETDAALSQEDFEDPARLAAAEDRLRPFMRPAGAMYTGQQHVRAMRGVQAMRTALGARAVEVAILSAGYGVVAESRSIAPYDVTFSGKSTTAIRTRGARLGVPAAARSLLHERDVVFLLLGSDYLSALDPPLPRWEGQRLVYFAKPSESRVRSDSVVVPAGKAEAGRYGAGLVALKGRMLELIGAAVSRSGATVLEEIRADPTPRTLVGLLDREAGQL